MEKYSWKINNKKISFTKQGKPIFFDTLDHWRNGICRLLSLNEIQLKKIVEKTALIAIKRYQADFYLLDPQKKAEVLRLSLEDIVENNKAFSRKIELNAKEVGPCGHKPDIVWERAIANNNNYTVIGCKNCRHGWISEVHLAKKNDPKTSYERNYFEGDKKGVGYGNYIDQKKWRLDKARRFVKKIEDICSLMSISIRKKPRVLDVGSGYGYFRQAVEEKNWNHEGIEISRYATEICKREFNFSTFIGTLKHFSKKRKEKFDIVTLWDVLEHVKNPAKTLLEVKSILKPGGICAIRTPNLISIERDILGKNFYSLKKEHLNYFSPRSINLFLQKSGLETVLIKTESNIFSGFFGGNSRFFEAIQKGSDIFVVAQNPPH